MKNKLIFHLVALLVFVLAGTVQVRAQCVGPMSVPILGSGSGLALTAGETHNNATCPGVDGSATITATGGTGPYMGTGTFPQMPGTQVYTVTDANGCSSSVSVTVLVLDNTPPSITCPSTNLVVTPNSGTCTFTIVGNEYNPVVSDNCGISSTMYTMISGSVSPSSGSSLAGAVFGVGNTVIEWKVTDVSGLMNTCQFTVRVNPCIMLSGNLIHMGDGVTTGVGNGTVTLSGHASDTDGPTASGPVPTGGAYTLIANAGTNFTITPSKHISIPPFYVSLLNGLDAGDATAIQQHLVGINVVTDPYRMVAADANKSSTISTVDAAIIRQAVLLNPSAIAILNTTKSWRFIPTNYTLTYVGPYNVPIGFPETRSVTTMVDMTGLDFHGVKVGDFVETANPANKPDPDAKPMVWRVRDRVLKTGQTINLDFSVENFTDIAAYQYALNFDPAMLKFEQIEVTGTGISLDPAGNFGLYNLQMGELRTLWSVAQGVTLQGVAPMFRLRFTVLEGGKKLSEVLAIDPTSMAPVAYNTALSQREVRLIFTDYLRIGSRDIDTDAEVATEPELLPNRPNPFSDRTIIGFILPEACDAQLRILDISGRELYRIDKSYPAGYNEELIQLRDIRATGILYYELTTPSGKLTRKMTAVAP